MTETTLDREELAQLVYGEQSPRCEVQRAEQDSEDFSDCGQRARWVGTFHCPHDEPDRPVLACDECHDHFEAHGNITDPDDPPPHHTVSWREL